MKYVMVAKAITVLAVAGLVAGPGMTQLTSVDPSVGLDAMAPAPSVSAKSSTPTAPPAPAGDATLQSDLALPGDPAIPANPPSDAPVTAANGTYKRDDVIAAAEGVFGKGAKGLAGIVERVLREQGEPNAYIAGREASGALVVGLRYGSGTLTHTIEGQRPVYWTGPSIGFDVGGDATKTFVLVYNLYDTQDLYRRYPQVEGRAYYVGGFSATYMRRGNVAIIPIRLGVGVRLGVNAGYMKFSEKSKWLPF
jgi:hypothetical protein